MDSQLALNQILDLMGNLNPKDLSKLQKQISPNKQVDTIENIRFDNGRVCPYCGCIHIVRNGHRPSDYAQQYVCRDCGKSFVLSSNSILEHTHKDLETWKTYIDCMLQGMSIRKCAKVCEINIKTSFKWRHKILDALGVMQSNLKLSGIVEADETYFEKSFKGMKKANNEEIMGRLPHERGGDHNAHTVGKDENGNPIIEIEDKKKRGLSNNLVCVPCAINRNGVSVAKVGKEGKVNLKAIEIILGNKIKLNSVLCTDKEKSYRQFSADKDLKLVQLQGTQRKNGIYHINTINSYHSGFKRFIRPMNGVATKYLNNYLVWYNYLTNNKGNTDYKENALFKYLVKLPFYEKVTEIDNRPALPFVC